MFGMSGTEMAILLILGLLLLGPQKLPEIARGLGKGMRDFRRATEDIKNSVETEFMRMDEPPKPPSPELPKIVKPEGIVAVDAPIHHHVDPTPPHPDAAPVPVTAAATEPATAAAPTPATPAEKA